LNTGKERGSLQGYKGSATSMEFSPDGKTLAAWTSLGQMIMWEVATGRVIHNWSLHGQLYGNYTSDCRHLVTYITNGNMYITRLGTPPPRRGL
jgi:WD40 repeat protein